jgi:hypothetical protein
MSRSTRVYHGSGGNGSLVIGERHWSQYAYRPIPEPRSWQPRDPRFHWTTMNARLLMDRDPALTFDEALTQAEQTWDEAMR